MGRLHAYKQRVCMCMRQTARQTDRNRVRCGGTRMQLKIYLQKKENEQEIHCCFHCQHTHNI